VLREILAELLSADPLHCFADPIDTGAVIPRITRVESERQIEGLIELDERAERESAELYGASITSVELLCF